ncbi:hypothetical protein [Kitasatospora sp. NPDC059327]|uniref:hypothetical protein n=1 Tax=Kitasatospora sp. NPDC059327 TaxID=3346803 RepID=UPI0036CE8DFB
MIRILASEGCVGDAFFDGGGGDATVWECLADAGWSWRWSEADYYWCMQASDGSAVTYIEGDIYRGNTKSPTLEEK